MTTLAELYQTDKAHYGDYQATPNGDIGLDSGNTNLQNALFRRLVTSKGSIIHRPGYGVGIKDFQGKLNTLKNQRELALRIDEQFPLDPRVQSVDSVTISQDSVDPGKTFVVVKVTPIGQSQISMKFIPFGGA